MLVGQKQKHNNKKKQTQKYYKLSAIYLSKQQAWDPDTRVILQINFTGNLQRTNNDDKTQIFFNLKEVRETSLDFYLILI